MGVPYTIQPNKFIRPVSNGYDSTNPDGVNNLPLSISGRMQHGEEITIATNGDFDFGTRGNIKPLYVNLGDSKVSSSLGRVAVDIFRETSVAQEVVRNGKSDGSIKCDLMLTNSTTGSLVFDPEKPVIVAVDRFYDFDITEPQYQNSTGGFNLKSNRFWAGSPAGGVANVYIGYQGSEGGKTSRVVAEYLSNNVNNYYSSDQIPFEWVNEEFIFKHSSSAGIRDGLLNHYRDNTLLNPTKNAITTYTEENPSKIREMYFDQVSNGMGSGVNECPIYFGTIVVDDEYNGVYVGNSPNRSSCTKMYRLPQTQWDNNMCKAIMLETFTSSDLAYIYIRTGENEWVSEEGLRS